MDTLASLAAAASAAQEARACGDGGGIVVGDDGDDDEFDAIVPMQLDQPPPPMAKTTATMMAQQQQQGFFSSPVIQQQQTRPSPIYQQHHHQQQHQQHYPHPNTNSNYHPQQPQPNPFDGNFWNNHQQQQQMPTPQSHTDSNPQFGSIATFVDNNNSPLQQQQQQHESSVRQQQQHWHHQHQQQQQAPFHQQQFPFSFDNSQQFGTPHQQQGQGLLNTNNNGNWQMPPLRKESMPALHLLPVDSSHHQHHQQHPAASSHSQHCSPQQQQQSSPYGQTPGNGGGSTTTIYGNYAQRVLGIDHQQQQQRIRSYSTAIFPCSTISPNPPAAAQHYQQQQQLNGGQQQQLLLHSPSNNINNMFDAQQQQSQGQWQQQQQLMVVEQRRTKSTVVPPTTSLTLRTPSPHHQHHHQQQQQYDSHQYGNNGSGNYSPNQQQQQQHQQQVHSPPPHRSASIVHSLRRFSSQLRSPCRSYSTAVGIVGGSGENGTTASGSTPAIVGTDCGGQAAAASAAAPATTAAAAPLFPPLQLKPYTPPPILSPMRQGSGLFSRIVCSAQKERKPSSLAVCIGNNNTLLEEKFERQKYIKDMVMDHMALTNGTGLEELGADEEQNNNHQRKKTLPNGINGKLMMEDMHAARDADSICSDEPGKRPQRKNGTILFAADGPSGSGLSFAAELEQLRKQSSVSYRSNKASMYGNRMSIRHGKLSLANEEFIRKMSTVSMEELEGEDGEKPPESDSIPHINLGKNYQARVKKWADRAISAHERNAIPDRDEQMFSAQSVEHIPQQALAAYETLSCSVALPKPGRNKELALHILAENQGNLQAAVMDLLRCDTLDWEQYQAVYNSRYVDVDAWTPEEINMFQDAIYKSEKDFPQVAAELGNRSVQECVAFYYTWKKACPDDYRKLRNLRRKRQLLEQQLDLTSFDQHQPAKTREELSSEGEEERDFSEAESDITTHSLGTFQPMEYLPDQPRKYSHLTFHPITVSATQPPLPDNNPLTALLAPAAVAAAAAAVYNGQTQQQQQLFNGSHSNGAGTGFPWLHGTDGIFPSPSSSSTSTNDNNQNVHFDAASQFGGVTNIGNVENGQIGGGRMTHNGGYSTKIRHSHHHAVAIKKGAQPQADGFFHCRLCEKRFEKVKSLNAHMKSHAMKARAEAEAQQKQQQLAFPLPTKKEQSFIAGHDKTAPPNPLDVLAVSTALNGMPGLTSQAQAQAAMAALNSLGRQIQQQQATGQQQSSPFSAVGANSGFGLLRNMLQYGQQHANGMAPTTRTGGTWPPSALEQHFNA